jgi:hypothetical protein
MTRLVVINIPSVFGIIWRLFTPLLPAATVRKIAITARGSRVQKDVLATYLPPSDKVLLAQGAASCLELLPAAVKVHAESRQGKLRGVWMVAGVIAWALVRGR